MKTNNVKTLIITGTPFVERAIDNVTKSDYESSDYCAEPTVSYGYKNLTIRNWTTGKDEPLSKDESKFIAHANTLAEAKAEFWFRWKQYIKTRFNREYAQILLPQ